MSDWVMRWFDSQHRQIKPHLEDESNGAIRWAEQWAVITFNPPEGPVQELSPEAYIVLKAEREEQLRINRDDFIEHFKNSLKLHEAVLFFFPISSDLDGRALSDWCEAHARFSVGDDSVAKMVITPTEPLEMSNIIAQLLRQWGRNVHVHNEHHALTELETFTATNLQPLVSIIASEKFGRNQLKNLLKAFFKSPRGSDSARVCFLLAHKAAVPKGLDKVPTIRVEASPFSQTDIESHLQRRGGYREDESREKYEQMSAIGFASKPAKVYKYIETHCGLRFTEG